jgi:hypothetical protein
MLLLSFNAIDPAEAFLACSSSKFCLDCTRPTKIKMRNDLIDLPTALGFTMYQTRTRERANKITDCSLNHCELAAKVEEAKSTSKRERRRKIDG